MTSKPRDKMPITIREMQIKPTMRYHFTPIRMAIAKKKVLGCGEIITLVYCWWECKMVENSMEFPQVLKQNYHMIQQFISGYICKRIESRVSKSYLYSCVHSSIIHNSYSVETTRVSTNKWMVRQNVVYVYHRIVFSLKMETNSAVCCNMYELWRHYAKWNNLVTRRQILCNSMCRRPLKQSKPQSECRRAAARGWGRGMES